MGWVHAPLVVADMVDEQAVRNPADSQLVGEAVRSFHFRVDLDYPIPLGVDGACPVPAAVSLFDFGPETFFGCMYPWPSHSCRPFYLGRDGEALLVGVHVRALDRERVDVQVLRDCVQNLIGYVPAPGADVVDVLTGHSAWCFEGADVLCEFLAGDGSADQETFGAEFDVALHVLTECRACSDVFRVEFF